MPLGNPFSYCERRVVETADEPECREYSDCAFRLAYVNSNTVLEINIIQSQAVAGVAANTNADVPIRMR
ncbi:hypothetical protein TSAR_005376, partial [Trichomalopsis sarcophagae]